MKALLTKYQARPKWVKEWIRTYQDLRVHKPNILSSYLVACVGSYCGKSPTRWTGYRIIPALPMRRVHPGAALHKLARRQVSPSPWGGPSA